MALIECKYCGEAISDKAQTCPHCGASLIEEIPLEPLICEDCGKEIPNGQNFCPACGCPVIQRAETSFAPEYTSQAVTVKPRKISTKVKVLIAIVLVAVIVAVGYFIISQNVLFGDDKVAYELILDAAHNFKNPSSVRLVSGTVGVDKDCLFAVLSATNGFGARTTGYYYVTGGWIMESENPISILYNDTKSLNIEKINRMLEKALGKY